MTAAAGRWLAESLPNCYPHFLADQGHLMALTHMDEILRDLVAKES